MPRTFSPEEAQAIRDAFLLARRTLHRRLSAAESQALAKVVLDVARPGQIDVNKLATRAIARVL